MSESDLPPELDPRLGNPATAPTSPDRTDTYTDAPADRSRRRKFVLVTTRTFATIVSLLILASAALIHSTITRFNAMAGTLPGISQIAGNTNAAPSLPAAPKVDGTDQNILIIGDDNRAGYTPAQLAELSTQENVGNNTDTLMLIHVPANGTAASIVSIPRDSYVPIPGYGKNKINSAYSDGYNDAPSGSTAVQEQAAGQAVLISTISALSGVKIDHVVTVSLLGFYNLTNQLGGIQVNLCQAASDPDSGTDLPAGKTLLDGKQALSFVRQRHGLPNGDLDRIKRQQFFVGAVIRKLLGQNLLNVLNLSKLSGLIDALANTIHYDKDLNPLDLAAQMRNLAAGNVNFYTIPLQPAPFATVPGVGSVLMTVDQAQMYAFFQGLSATAAGPSSGASSSAAATGSTGSTSAAPGTSIDPVSPGAAPTPKQSSTAADAGCIA